MKSDKILTSNAIRYGISLAVVLAITGILRLANEHVNLTTIALAFLLVVLSSATFFGRNPALLASFAAMLSFNYLFVPPVGTWHIADPQNLVAWAAFTITAIVAGELSAYASRRAREAERLYSELQAAFNAATEAEALKQSEKLKSALLDAVTHDLRTPLTSIKASVTTLLDSEGGHRTIELDSDGRTEFLDIINEETDRLNRFIEGMVELARIEAGAADPSGKSSSVDAIVSGAIERAKKLTGGHAVNVSIGPELPMVRADARTIAEVLYNLLENSTKYSPSGSVITVGAEKKGDAVEISVNDQGRGIPPDMREKVFEQFVRLDGPQAGGMGLGLAIARGIVEAQNGRILISNGQDDIGTKVVIELPISRE